jgi:hypothetical protein
MKMSNYLSTNTIPALLKFTNTPKNLTLGVTEEMINKIILIGIDMEEMCESNEPEIEELYYKLWEDDRL